jgi:hypothetical protein
MTTTWERMDPVAAARDPSAIEEGEGSNNGVSSSEVGGEEGEGGDCGVSSGEVERTEVGGSSKVGGNDVSCERKEMGGSSKVGGGGVSCERMKVTTFYTRDRWGLFSMPRANNSGPI